MQIRRRNNKLCFYWRNHWKASISSIELRLKFRHRVHAWRRYVDGWRHVIDNARTMVLPVDWQNYYLLKSQGWTNDWPTKAQSDIAEYEDWLALNDTQRLSAEDWLRQQKERARALLILGVCVWENTRIWQAGGVWVLSSYDDMPSTLFAPGAPVVVVAGRTFATKHSIAYRSFIALAETKKKSKNDDHRSRIIFLARAHVFMLLCALGLLIGALLASLTVRAQ